MFMLFLAQSSLCLYQSYVGKCQGKGQFEKVRVSKIFYKEVEAGIYEYIYKTKVGKRQFKKVKY